VYAAAVSTWLVTGANRGIGLELCRQLAARGDQVIATARDPERAGELRVLPVRVESLDVVEQRSVDALGRALEADATGIDVLVNNAGLGGAEPGIVDLDWEAVEQYFRINAIGPMRLVQALLPALRRGRERKIVQLSSNLASIGDNRSGGYYAYRSSKAALNMLNRSLALELEPERFTCVALHPGWLQTDMGGPNAPTPLADGVARFLRVIDGAGPADSGQFLAHDGRELPW
jgi:NAD(P)-dependent dehydrogenase (short-subunit alcohol dehydrogenase family)